MIDALGWLGSVFLAICAFPQAWKSWKEGNSNGLSHALLWLWGGGEVFTLAYVLAYGSAPLILNYVCNMAAIGVIIKYKYWPRT